jgi:hypothetical protein
MRSIRPLLLVALLGGCATRSTAQLPSTPESAQTLPAGYGTLSQDQVAIRIRLTDLEVRFMPVEERLLRLLSPDAYASFHALVESQRPTIDSLSTQNGIGRTGLMLVTFFGQRQDVRFDPTQVGVSFRGAYYRPVAIVPYSGSFSSQQLPLRGQASGIFLFAERIPIFESFTVSYGANTSNEWDRHLPIIRREIARIESKARTEKPDTTGEKR